MRPPRLVGVLVALLLAGCDEPAPHDRTVYPAADWIVSWPGREGMKAARVNEAIDYAFDPTRNTQSVVVVRNGVIVAERYDPVQDRDSEMTSWSAGKSIASTVIGIAIDNGLVAGVDVPLATFYPSWAGTDHATISLRDAMQMRSGLAWDTGNYTTTGQYLDHGDAIQYAIGRPVVYPPGTVWQYSGGDSELMSGVIEAVTGANFEAYAQANLFQPIGMNVHWWQDEAGHTLTYCCVDGRAREFARFGLLIARDGLWNGRQIVSASWIATATTWIPEKPDYGLQWWNFFGTVIVNGMPQRSYVANGLYDQRIYVFPDLDLVVVRGGLVDHVGTGYVNSSYAFLLPHPPADWDDEVFITPILRSIDPTAEILGIGP